MDDTADHPGQPGILPAGTVLLIAGLLGAALLAANSDIALADDLDAVARKVDEDGNRAFYTFIVFWAMMIGLACAGLASVAALLARSGGAARGLGAAAATLAGIAGAVLVMVPVFYSALVNEWDPDIKDGSLTTGGYAVDVLESIPFGASQAGIGILLVGLVMLAAAFFASDEMNGAIGIPPLILSFFMIAVLEEGRGVSNFMVPLAALIVGAPVTWYGWAMRRGGRTTPRRPLGPTPPAPPAQR
ncbi:hypothetical protein [Acidipropionibacterium virtanenii]|nr:hypothetical protein [Acidipropionibacterium virtanenii]